MKKSKQIVAIILVFLMAMASFPTVAMAAGNTIYLQSGASGTTGTSSDPVGTFDTAKTLISDGDNIELMGSSPYSVTGTQNWSLASYPNSKLVTGSQFTAANWAYFINPGATLTLSDISISDTHSYAIGTIFVPTSASNLIIGSNVKIDGTIAMGSVCYLYVSAPLTNTLKVYIADGTLTAGTTIHITGTGGYSLTQSDAAKLYCARSGYHFEYNSSAGTITIQEGNAPTTITSANTTVSDIADQTYTGSDITPALSVKYGDTALTEGTDYTVSYSSNKNVGTATATITGMGSYAGSIDKTFNIVGKSISDSSVSVSAIADQTYTGSAIEPDVTVSDGSTALVKDTDYTVSYSTNTDVGTAKATISGKGNYTGSVEKTFSITAKSIGSGYTVDSIADQAYTGSAIEPSVTVKSGDTTLTKGTDYTVAYTNNVNVGTATATITGKGNYSGDITKTFTITPVSVSNASVSSASDKTYTGKALTPSITVKLNGATLKNGTDYTVSYSSNTNPGAAKITVKGMGNYTGSIVKTFNIIPKKQTLSSVKNSASKKLKITWKKDSTVSGYQVRYATSKSFGSAKTVLVKKNSTTSATVSKLTKKKTYYVQVRAYKTISGKAYYGAWSSVKSQKVSK